MKKIFTFLLGLIFLLSNLTIVSGEDNINSTIFISLTLSLQNTTILKDSLKLVSSPTPLDKKSDVGEYKLQLYSFKEVIQYQTQFDFVTKIYNAPPREWFDDEGNQIYFPGENESGPQELEKASTILFIPYFKNVKTIKIFKNEDLKLEIDVSEFANCNENAICDVNETHELCPEECPCGNGKCEIISGESYSTCSQDCPSGSSDNYCDKANDDHCDPDCLTREDIDCEQTQIWKILTVLFIGLIILLLAIMLVYKKRG